MSHRDPIFDRTLADITNKTAKGYFNVLDWIRIYENAHAIRSLAVLILSLNPTFITIAEPTMSTIPTDVGVNNLVKNIEAVRLLVAPNPVGAVVLKTDWGGARSPTYVEVNDWERNISLLWDFIIKGYSSWVPDSASPVRRPRTGIAASGIGLTRNNGWRNYD